MPDDRPMIPHRTGDALLKRLVKTEDELDAIHAKLRAIALRARTDPQWDGWLHELEMLDPHSRPRRAELAQRLRAEGLSHLAERMEFFGSGGSSS